ncbi:phage portal protein [Blastomonas sp.]|uniref:phage portal protein n=1 Tax=Blastomonas sp. TaxID=1909299 RepID=UPI0035945FC7
MGLIERSLARMGLARRSLDGDQLSWKAIDPAQGLSGSLSVRAAENLSTVLGCTNAISTALAYVPALTYRQDGANDRAEAPEHPLRQIVRGGVNPGMSWPDWVEHLVASTLLTGNGLAEILRGDRGQLEGFRHIQWGQVTAVKLASGRLAYDISDPRGVKRRLLEGDVVHLRDRTDDGYIGRSRLSRAAETVAGVQSANVHANSFLRNGASPSGVIESVEPMKAEQRTMLRESFMARASGPSKAGQTLILDGGLTWKPAQISPEDAELLETRKFGVEEICRLFQVPPPIVQDYSHNTFTNSETAGRWFATFCLAPWARKIEAEFARSVFAAGSGYELELDLSGFLRGDPEKRWAAHKIALESGVLDPEEVRQVEGWNKRQTLPNSNPEVEVA